jgi:hypothetical protein
MRSPLAEAFTTWLQSKPTSSSISAAILSGSALGKSILFKTGMISRLFS